MRAVESVGRACVNAGDMNVGNVIGEVAAEVYESAVVDADPDRVCDAANDESVDRINRRDVSDRFAVGGSLVTGARARRQIGALVVCHEKKGKKNQL